MRVMAVCVLWVLSVAVTAQELRIEITKGNDKPTVVAVVPFSDAPGAALPENVSAIISADLYRSGLFRLIPASDMLGLPHQESEVHYRDWRALGTEYLAVGKMGRDANGMILAKVELFDVYRQQKIFSQQWQAPVSDLRDMAHAISDRIYLALTGVRGAFSTKILYVSALNMPNKRYNYRLMVADSDGARPKQILESSEPILSPTWAPNGYEIAYVSFEYDRRPAIMRHNLRTGQRDKLTHFPGLNSAPAFSPDGRQLAMVLSKDGSPDIYIMDLSTRTLSRITKDNIAIDTEPAWMPDGKSLVFTSNRGGAPQIYRVVLAEGWTERMTFDGDYNARAVPLPDGSGIALVHRENGSFHIAVLEFATGRLKVLSHTSLASLDESPTIAPNGSMLMYATENKGRGILAAVSVDGSVSFNLPGKDRDVRDPSWSPFLNPPQSSR
ncbi:MAG TPA: Tol-Pal system beta propeller repeat protein TolB [Pseudomonadales bacterium]